MEESYEIIVAKESEEDVGDVVGADPEAYIEKPVNVRKLRKIVKSCLAGKS